MAIVFVTSLEKKDERLDAALQKNAPAAYIHKKSCRDGLEIARRIAQLAQERLTR